MRIIELDFNNNVKENITDSKLLNYPLVYILSNEKEVYIGETININKRIKSHYKNINRKNLRTLNIIYDEYFNQSATYNIETNLINYFIGDEKYKLQNISQTKQKVMHNYYNKDFYNNELFKEIWKELKVKNFVDNSLLSIENKDIFKLSPFKMLSEEQANLKEEIIDFCKANINNGKKSLFIVEGEAGSGKSVLISSLYNELQNLSKEEGSRLYKSNNYILVNHEEMLKSYYNLADRLPNLRKNKILKPTSFINKKDIDASITIVDEAHLLLTSPDTFNNFKGENQLLDIVEKNDITIAIFDEKQFLKVKSYWNKKEFVKSIKRNSVKVTNSKLNNQLRMLASEETIDWINSFV